MQLRLFPDPHLMPRSNRSQQPRGHRKQPLRPEHRDALAAVALFAGVGGIELGLHKSGHRTILFCEIDEAARHVLSERFQGIRQLPDICEMRSFPNGTELVTAGFPCQDLSQAGMTRGIAGARSGLVYEVFRLLHRRRVPWLLLENVPFMLQLGKGRALEVIVAELERLGYHWAYRVVDSQAFGLPQRRQRVFLLASREEDPRDVLLSDDVGAPAGVQPSLARANGFYWTEGVRGLGWADDAVPTLKGGSSIGIPSPPAILFPDGLVVTPDIRDAERMQGLKADWTRPVEEVAKKGYRWKLVGNAVTADVTRWIGRRLIRPNRYDCSRDVELQTGHRWPRAAWNIGEGRFVSWASAWPERHDSVGLKEFLRFPTVPLSEKATAGFYSRIDSSSLKFPPGFKDAIKSHLKRMRAAAIS